MTLMATVVVEKTTYAFDSPFSYLVPDSLRENVKVGCRVRVPFGNGNRKREALVIELEDVKTLPERNLKPVFSVIDDEPFLNREQILLVKLLHERTFCTYYDAVKILVPSGFGLKVNVLCSLNKNVDFDEDDEFPNGVLEILDYLKIQKKAVPLQTLQEDLQLSSASKAISYLLEKEIIILTEDIRRKVGDASVQMIRLCEEYELGLEEPKGLSQKQKSVYKLLLDCGCASVKEAAYFCGVTPAVIKNLVKKGIIEEFGKPVFRNPYENAEFSKEENQISLTAEQKNACENLREILSGNSCETALLYGVTGSGKTQVFLNLIEYVLEQGKQVIVMVPEISLTPQTVQVFQKRFGKRVAVMHSALTMGERVDEYKRIKQGLADVVIGTRSAVFAPMDNIGLIVMDEEQEKCYQSELSPKFHARDVAKWRCHYHNALLLLCSATPSVESFYQAKNNKYHLIRLDSRYHGGKLPDVNIVDISDQYGETFSPALLDEIHRNLQNKQQTILLINRRGYNTVVKCSNCGEVATCPNCSVALTYHSANGQLMCHYCGHNQNLHSECPSCGSKFVRYSGVGTQKVEEELNYRFPNARVLRMDLDTTMSRNSYEKKFSAFAKGDYDIMVGTQMVAKGHNFPNVTLVGVINADQSLFAQDFRSYENTFSLLTQVIGRCGRGNMAGRAYIQTSDPQHYVLEQAAKQDYDSFYESEILGRKMGLYPPYCDICSVGFTSLYQKAVKEAALRFGAAFKKIAEEEFSELPLRVFEPCEPSIEKIAGKYRFRLLIKCRQSKRFSQLMWKVLRIYDSDKLNKEIHLTVDMNYNGSM